MNNFSGSGVEDKRGTDEPRESEKALPVPAREGPREMLDALAWLMSLQSPTRSHTCPVCGYQEWGVGTMHVVTPAGGGECN